MLCCRLQTNAFVEGKAIKGNWEPLISVEVFLRVQQILSGNNQGYIVEKNNGSRPLTGTLICPICGKNLTGYEVKKKGLHYYKCQKCPGISINAESSEKMKTKGAHQLFIELLDSFRLDDKYIQPFILQLKKTFVSMKKDVYENRGALEQKKRELESELGTLDERFAYGKFDNEVLYYRFREEKLSEIHQVKEQLKDSDFEISNFDFYIERSVDISHNTHNIWQLGTLGEKRKLQKLVFPEGIVIDTKNRVYLTSKVNSLFLAKS